MQERPESNYELENLTVFDTLNQYFLLFFSMSCLLSSVFIQQVFILLGQSRLGITIAPVLGIVVPIFLLTRRFPTGFRKQMKIHAPRLRTMICVSIATFAMIVIIDHLYLLSQQFLPDSSYAEGLEELKPHGTWSILITFLGLCVIVPLAEEIVFRGMIQQVFTRNMGGPIAVVLSGVFFGVIHLNPQLLLSMACFGIFVGFIFFATENLTYTILAHGIVNSVAFVQLTFATDESLQTAPFYLQGGWLFFISVAVVAVLLRQIKKGVPVKEDSL